MVSDLQLREAFHFLFLERLLSLIDTRGIVLKGGVNLRFFFSSPRYSEDMDLDVRGIPVHLLREKVYGLLEDKSLLRSLQVYGIRELRINDPRKAKQTDTTQRFRLRLATSAGEELPTKVEFSRRRLEETAVLVEPVNPEIARRYERISFLCPHYAGEAAVAQKVRALASRRVPQARDLFDLYILHLAGHVPRAPDRSSPLSELENARENLLELSYDAFRDQVLDFLDEPEREKYGHPDSWDRIRETVLSFLIDHGLAADKK